MSADIQERWMRHKAPLLEGRTRGRSSCPPGQAAIRLPPSCQGLEKWPIHTQDIGSVFKDRQDTGARNTYTGRCVFLTTRDTHWRTFRRESKNTLKKKKKHTHTSMLFISLTTVSRFINHLITNVFLAIKRIAFLIKTNHSWKNIYAEGPAGHSHNSQLLKL